jgi:hypothetical protein
VTDVTETVANLTVDGFSSARELVDFFKAAYGPTIAVFRSLGEDAERAAALDAALVELAARFGADDGTLRWEYLIVTAVRA